MKISLLKILESLVAKGAEIEKTSTPNEGGLTPTSIRLKPATKLFLESQSTALNISIQGLISTILDGVAEATSNVPALTLRTIRERFFYLFEAHRISYPDIISILNGRGFSLSTLDSPARLFDLMTNENIDFLSKTFFVKKEWLCATSDYVVDEAKRLRWHKNVSGVGATLLEYAKSGFKPQVFFIRKSNARFEFASANQDNFREHDLEYEPIGIVVKLTCSSKDGNIFYTYRIGQFERWNYENCRSEFKLLIAFCSKADRWIRSTGCQLSRDEIGLLESGKILPSKLLNNKGANEWNPNNYAGFDFPVVEEVEQWKYVLKKWNESQLPSIIEKFNGNP